jgi:hypothetical protein
MARQCHGFALTLGDALTRSNLYGWNRIYNLNSIKPRDIIRCKNSHTILVTEVSGNIITYVIWQSAVICNSPLPEGQTNQNKEVDVRHRSIIIRRGK